MQEPVNLLAPNSGLMFWTLLFMLGGVTLLLAGSLYWLRRRARAKRSASYSTTLAMPGSVAALEAEVAQLRTDVAQLELAQDFTTQLLARPSAPRTTHDRSLDPAPAVVPSPDNPPMPDQKPAR